MVMVSSEDACTAEVREAAAAAAVVAEAGGDPLGRGRLRPEGGCGVETGVPGSECIIGCISFGEGRVLAKSIVGTRYAELRKICARNDFVYRTARNTHFSCVDGKALGVNENEHTPLPCTSQVIPQDTQVVRACSPLLRLRLQFLDRMCGILRTMLVHVRRGRQAREFEPFRPRHPSLCLNRRIDYYGREIPPVPSHRLAKKRAILPLTLPITFWFQIIFFLLGDWGANF